MKARFQPITWPRQPAPTETDVQKPVAEFLSLVAGPDTAPRFMWFHVPNGEGRSKASAGILKAMGVRAGVWDFIIFAPRSRVHPGMVTMLDIGQSIELADVLMPIPFFIEMKRPTPTGKRRVSIENQLSAEQKAFRRQMVSLGLPESHFAVCDDVTQVAEALKRWGII